jgi:ATP-dependent DNA helicase RecQ
LDWLISKEKENRRASELITALGSIRQSRVQNIWWQLIDQFLENYREETADSILPVGRAINRFYEFTAEQRREKVIGHGIYLSTVHSSKGMEFPHVFILDGDWGKQRRPKQWEEERRVMYVGMTRAEETLCLMKAAQGANPFLSEIRGDFVVYKTYKTATSDNGLSEKRYKLIELNAVYLDYAGCFTNDHIIHKHLASLEAGQSVKFCPKANEIEIHTAGGCRVAKLSKEGSAKWSQRMNQICDLRVVALLRRNRDDPQEGFQNRIKADWWELPVLEAVYTPSGPLHGRTDQR